MKNKLGVLLTLGALVILVGAGCAKTNSPAVEVEDEKQVESTEVQPMTKTEDETKPVTENKDALVKPGQDTTVVDTGRSMLTVAEVAKHNVPEDCYIMVRTSVYDVTKFTDKHPGGSEAIIPLCGKDATAAFTKQHGGQDKPEGVLTGLKIGELAK